MSRFECTKRGIIPISRRTSSRRGKKRNDFSREYCSRVFEKERYLVGRQAVIIAFRRGFWQIIGFLGSFARVREIRALKTNVPEGNETMRRDGRHETCSSFFFYIQRSSLQFRHRGDRSAINARKYTRILFHHPADSGCLIARRLSGN